MRGLQNISNIIHMTTLMLRLSSKSYLVIYVSNTDRYGNKFLMLLVKEIVYRYDTSMP